MGFIGQKGGGPRQRRQGMKKNILMRTNLMICAVIVVGFLLTAVLSYRANYTASLQNIEQVSTLTSEGIYYQIDTTLTKPLNISLTCLLYTSRCV